MKKKSLIILLSLIMTITMAGCGVRTLEEPPQNISSDKATETDSSESIFTAVNADLNTENAVSLQSWLNGETKEQIVTDANAQLNPVGLSIDFYAEGDNVLVVEYTFTEQQNMGNDQDKINKTFDEAIVPIYSDSVTSLFDSFKSEYGIALKDIKLAFINADGTELYSRYYNES